MDLPSLEEPQSYLFSPLHRMPPRDQATHERVWQTIFRTSEWLKIIVGQLGLNPVLISQQLHEFRQLEGRQGPAYMVLAVWDTKGDLPRYKDELFKSLQEHTYDPLREEVIFSSGVVLNIHNVLHAQECIPVDTARLFEEEEAAQLSTSYLLWIDPAYSLERAKKEDFLGPHTTRGTRAAREAILHPSNPNFCCEMRLKAQNHSVWFTNEGYRRSKLRTSASGQLPRGTLRQGTLFCFPRLFPMGRWLL